MERKYGQPLARLVRDLVILINKILSMSEREDFGRGGCYRSVTLVQCTLIGVIGKLDAVDNC